MWNTAVSFGNTVLEHTAEVFRQHPLIGAGFVISQSALTILFGIEVLSGFRTTKPADPWKDVQPMRLRR